MSCSNIKIISVISLCFLTLSCSKEYDDLSTLSKKSPLYFEAHIKDFIPGKTRSPAPPDKIILPAYNDDGSLSDYQVEIISAPIKTDSVIYNALQSNSLTRAEIMKSSNLNSPIGLYGAYDDTFNGQFSNRDVFFNYKLTKALSGKWETPFYCGKSSKINFLAYFPYDGNSMCFETNGQRKKIRISDPFEQKDLLMAFKEVQPGSNPVNLNFFHILSSLEFSFDHPEFSRFWHIKVCNVFNEGEINYSSGNMNVIQTGQSKLKKYFAKDVHDENGYNKPYAEKVPVMNSSSDKYRLYILPQCAPEDAYIEVVAHQANEIASNVKIPIASFNFKQGYNYTINIKCRPMMALEHFDHSLITTSTGIFHVEHNDNTGTATLDVPAYAILTEAQWKIVFPNPDCIKFQGSKSDPHTIMELPNRGSFTSNATNKKKVTAFDYPGSESEFITKNNITYAIRFKNTKYASAWRYQLVQANNKITLILSQTSIKNGTKITEIATPSFWDKKKRTIITKEIASDTNEIKIAVFPKKQIKISTEGIKFESYREGESIFIFPFRIT